MAVDQPDTLTSPMTYDEVSMERSKGFVKALQIKIKGLDWTGASKCLCTGCTQEFSKVLCNLPYPVELKNLRPQLYSAAEYCEKSYLHSEQTQKQMVLDNLKDYVVRALVNAVDHLGTVAYKLTDLLEQQTSDVSNTELKITCLNQRLLTCQTYIDKEGLRQQQLLAIIPRYHKRYILPNSVNKKVHFSPVAQADSRQIHVQARPRVHPSDSPGTLSWHIDSETNFPIKGTPKTAYSSSEVLKSSLRSSPMFHLFDNEDSIRGKYSGAHTQLSNPNSTAASSQPSHRVMDSIPNSKPMTPYRSFDNVRQPIVKAPLRHKSMLSAFFVKHKTQKLRSGTVP